MTETAVIGAFYITQETAVAQGVRRIEALTGRGAQHYANHRIETLNAVSRGLGVQPDMLPERISALQNQIRQQAQDIAALQRRLAKAQFDTLQAEPINGAKVLIARVDNVDGDTLREMTDWFRDRNPQNGVVVLGTVSAEGKPALIAAVTQDLTSKVHAGNLIKEIAAVVGGGGGGKPTMAQAGGKDASKLNEALDRAAQWVSKALGN